MDKGVNMDSKLLLNCCRICVSECAGGYCIHERTAHPNSVSLHCMLEKLFPAIFNSEQLNHDRSMNWPETICRDCKCKVIDAYALYEQCEKSVDLLNQQQMTSMICNGASIVSNGQYFSDKRSEDTPLPTEEIFALQLVKLDDSMQLPSTASLDDKCNEINTHVLQEQCETSDDLLNQQQSNPISNGVPILIKGESAANYPSEKERLLTDLKPLEVSSSVLLVDLDEDPIVPSKRQNVRNLRRTKQKQTNNNEEKTPTDHTSLKDETDAKRSKSQSQDGNLSDEKSKENFHLQRAIPKTNKVRKPKERKGLGATIDSSRTTDADEEKLETKINQYNCLFCDAPTYFSPTDLTEHLQANHANQIRHCEQCPKVFMSQTSFEQHQYCHATGRSYFCTFCDKGFQTEKLRKSHIRTHTHQSDFLCSHCGKKFNNKSNLRQHIIGHSGHKPWACNLCPCRFSTKGGLTIHQNTHTKEKAFSCDTCGSQFNKHYSLIKHKLIHTGERPFGCEICGMRFTTSYMVKRHMRTHTGEKPFKCTYCERSFAQSNDMVKHMKIHVGNTPYQCDRCDESFRLLSDLRNHYKAHYQTGEPDPGSSPEQGDGIRFTSIDILQIRYKKEKGALGNER